jgi:hypothetical protein
VELPPVSPDRLAAESAAALAGDPTFSGTVRIHFDLGVPNLGDSDLPGVGPLGALLGDHTVRVWRSPFGARLALVEPTTERDFYLGRDGGWTWDFASLTATRVAPPGIRTGLFPLDLLVGPEDFQGLLDGLRPTTRVVVDHGLRVAGRAAYPLALEPRTPGTLVGRVEIDVDAERHLPLALRVFPRGSPGRAALEVGFTSIGFGSIDSHAFDFSPPPGAVVARSEAASSPLGLLGALGFGIVGASRLPGVEEVRTFGHDWAGVVAVRFAGAESSGLLDLGSLLPVSGPLLSARLFERPGRFWLLAGAVPQSTLARVERLLR